MCGLHDVFIRAVLIHSCYTNMRRIYSLITMPLSLDFPKYVYAIVITQSSAHLVIIHRQMIFLYSP